MPFLRLLEDVLLSIFELLTTHELKDIRNVCKKTEKIARPLLFRSLHISVLPCDLHRLDMVSRDTSLAMAVEEVVFNELQFDVEERGPRNVRTVFPNAEDQYMYAFQGLGSLDPLRYMDKDIGFYEEPSSDCLRNLCQSLERRHANMKAWLTTQDFLREDRAFDSIITKALSKFLRLKRVISRDARDGGVQKDTGYQMYATRGYEGSYPVGEGQLRHLIFDQSQRSPDLGFWAMLEALARSRATVHTLVTERTIGLMKRGIPLNGFQWHGPVSSNTLRIAGFRNFRSISLCVDSGNRVEQSSYPNPQESDSTHVTTDLHKFLEAAIHLESLQLSLTGALSTLVSFRHLLGMGSWRSLSLLILESIAFTESEIIGFITRHAGSLKHLTLWKCGLKGLKGCWANVIKAMSQMTALGLESLKIKGPRYVVGLPFQGPTTNQATSNDAREARYALEPPEETLLDYVNTGQGINPYEQYSCGYYGRQGDEADVYSDCSDADAYSDYSESASSTSVEYEEWDDW